MNRSQDRLAVTMKDAAKLVGIDYRTLKLGIENGTILTVQLGPSRMIPALFCRASSASTPEAAPSR